ncbi:MAG: NAD+ synthase [Dehalococcoidales bacterium]|nr:NAD+ synthase [Dehalococcoidales bacterium]
MPVYYLLAGPAKERTVETEERVHRLVAWIKDAVKGAGFRGVVFGMSGGIDSSLLAVLCKRAFPENVLGLVMPCHSIPEDKAHAELVADKFGIPTRTVVLDAVYDTLIGVLPGQSTDESVVRLAQGNLKARLRMIVLYYFANQMNYIVAGSSNRSELAIGYFTKYGDGGVDIMPLGNLVKQEIRELSRHLGIPQVIIDKPPSAGLWEGQTDEAEMGFTYEVLDRYLLTGDAPDDIKAHIERRMRSSRHKRALPPIPQF